MIAERFFLFLLLLIAASTAVAQNQSAIDSLENELKKNLPDTSRVQVLASLATQFKGGDPKTGLRYADQAEHLATGISYKPGLVEVYHAKAILFQANKQPGMALLYRQKKTQLDNELKGIKSPHFLDSTGKFRRPLQSDTSAHGLDEKGQILQMLIQSLRRNNKNKDDSAQELKNIAEANEMLGNYEEALKYHQMYEQVKDSLSESERNSQLAARDAALKSEALEL